MKLGWLYKIIIQLHAKKYLQNVIRNTDPRMLINVRSYKSIYLFALIHPFFCKNVKHNYLRKNRKEVTESILKDCFFYFSDPGCYKLVNKTKVSIDLDSGGPEFVYNEMLIKCFIMIFSFKIDLKCLREN